MTGTGQRETLVRLLQQALDKGHWRLALRRYFMLRECAYALPADLEERCAGLAKGLSRAQLDKVRRAAAQWRAFVLQPKVVAPAAPRTVWRTPGQLWRAGAPDAGRAD